MPTPKPMNKPAAPSKPNKAQEQVKVTQPEKKAPPLFRTEKTEALIPSKQSVAVPIPSFLQTTAMPETSDRSTTGYVGFASTQSKKWTDQQRAGIEDGQPFLFHEKNFIPLDTLEFFLTMGKSCQTMMAGKSGEFIYYTDNMEERQEPIIYKGNQVKLEPHYVVLMLVKLGDALIPIKGDFRGTKSGGMENAIRAVEAASNPDWLKLSEAHKATAAFPQPWGRVFHTIGTTRHISKSNGNPYFTADCGSTPASVSEMQLLVSNLKNEDFTNALTDAHENYNKRIEYLLNVNEEHAKKKNAG